ncbi:MAG: SMC family ATPase [Synechococcales cyanobacterium K44_A2020_017]|nr:SMC family ATPase [Synechococcales cyanobacterium K32_A2020_035]MBF2093706.1 SMC family ATPase [Synechococcales cyanobacterium K44_A2020_017]
MQILSVTLTNFKTHQDRHFVFQPGVNTICGENGAGKTSIVEAIAWVLFNYRGSYKNEDLIRNGQSSAQVAVEFVSSHDERTYQVQRCTTKGYRLYDPQLDHVLNYRHIEDEVTPWLRQQLGIAPGIDLGQLFANTIGVPQGTVTADFLQPPTQRKQIFDAILKVEEFRLVYKETGALEKYAKAELDQVKQAIAQYNESLEPLPELQSRQAALVAAIAQDETHLAALEQELAQLEQRQAAVQQQQQQLQTLTAQKQAIAAQVEAKQSALKILEQALQTAQQAANLCAENRESYDLVLQAEQKLADLEQQRKQRHHLQTQRQDLQRQLTLGQNQLTRYALQLEQVEKAEQDCDRLQPLLETQRQLEEQQQHIDQQIQALSAQTVEFQSLEQHLNRLRGQWKQVSQEIDRIQPFEAAIAAIPDQERQRDRLQQQLSRVEAAKQFEAELRHLVTHTQAQRQPHLDRIQAGIALLRQLPPDATLQKAIASIEADRELTTDLITALQGILSELGEQVSAIALGQQVTQVTQALDQVYRQRAEVATLEEKRHRLVDLKAEGEQTRSHLEQLNQQLAQITPLQTERSHLTQQLAALDNPRARHQVLTQELQRRPALLQDQQAAQLQLAEVEDAIATLDLQLVPFAQLDRDLEHQQQQRQQHQAGYLAYLRYRNDADQVPKRQADLEQAIADLQQSQDAAQAIEQQYQILMQDYDAEAAEHLRSRYEATRRQVDRLSGSLPQQRQRQAELAEQVQTLMELAHKRDQAEVDLKTKERIKRLVSFARKVYKEAGPRITERYVQTVSQEADRLFRELLNRPNVALEWTRDYDIVVQEGAHNRRFMNLSGGEQMCAALAVRLALLRVFAEIDIAFFDEPTTNMDRPRRRHLAEAIANLKSFQQLFVISHDDTFEQVTEHVIFVERLA